MVWEHLLNPEGGEAASRGENGAGTHLCLGSGFVPGFSGSPNLSQHGRTFLGGMEVLVTDS